MKPTSQQYAVLQAIVKAGEASDAGVTNAQIAAALGNVTPDVVAVYTGEMWKRDYLDRTRQLDGDRAPYVYTATAIGRGIIDAGGSTAATPSKIAAARRKEIERQAQKMADAIVPGPPTSPGSGPPKERGTIADAFDGALTIVLSIFRDDSGILQSPNGTRRIVPDEGRKLRELCTGGCDGE